MKKVLVVVDMQKDFITGCLSNEACRQVVPKVCEVITKGDFDHVFVTKDTHFENYMDTQEGRKLPVIHCVKGTEGWELNDAVAQALKSTYGEQQITEIHKKSFGSLELAKFLQQYAHREEETMTVSFVGVCTGICVISNVFIAKAALPEARVCVIENACACVTEESHQTAIAAMKTSQVDMETFSSYDMRIG